MKRFLHAAAGVVAHGACVLLLALLTVAPLRAQSLETIPLHHRTAEDLLPLLQPLVPAGAALTGAGDVLLVRADAATMQQLRTAIATLDRAPRQLLITVSQVTNVQGSGTSVRGSGTIGSGDVQVGVNEQPRPTAGGQVVLHSGTGTDDLRNVSSVRALEGYESYVAMGQSRPFTSTTVLSDGRYPPLVTETTQYRDVQTGFYVTPRISGDRVTLELSPSQQRVTGNVQRNGAVTTSSVTTTVTGRIGEWIEIGGTSETAGGSRSGLVTWGTRSDLTQYSAWVKVDEIR